MSWKKLLPILGIGIFILSACSGESAEDRIHNHLEEAVVLEQEFETQQNEITELEKEEQEIYAQVIDLSAEEFDEIQSLSQEAIQIIEEREEKIEIERESILQAKEEFESIEALFEDLEENVQPRAEEMYETMMERYATYDSLYESYKESLDQEVQLYTILQEEDVEQEQLNEHIESINASYEEILSANDTFNELTIEYNNLKQEFYNEANFQAASE